MRDFKTSAVIFFYEVVYFIPFLLMVALVYLMYGAIALAQFLTED
jgi:hypothetical protein